MEMYPVRALSGPHISGSSRCSGPPAPILGRTDGFALVTGKLPSWFLCSHFQWFAKVIMANEEVLLEVIAHWHQEAPRIPKSMDA
jgi:hypothetical protein